MDLKEFRSEMSKLNEEKDKILKKGENNQEELEKIEEKITLLRKTFRKSLMRESIKEIDYDKPKRRR